MAEFNGKRIACVIEAQQKIGRAWIGAVCMSFFAFMTGMCTVMSVLIEDYCPETVLFIALTAISVWIAYCDYKEWRRCRKLVDEFLEEISS